MRGRCPYCRPFPRRSCRPAESSAAFGILDDSFGRAIFDGTARVEKFGFADDRSSERGRQFGQHDVRRSPIVSAKPTPTHVTRPLRRVQFSARDVVVDVLRRCMDVHDVVSGKQLLFGRVHDRARNSIYDRRQAERGLGIDRVARVSAMHVGGSWRPCDSETSRTTTSVDAGPWRNSVTVPVCPELFCCAMPSFVPAPVSSGSICAKAALEKASCPERRRAEREHAKRHTTHTSRWEASGSYVCGSGRKPMRTRPRHGVN